MATRITDDCVYCDACMSECPNDAISPGDDLYIIDPERCTECVGFHDHEACQAVCPAEACLPDPARIESEEVLLTRARSLHPTKSFPLILPASRTRFSNPNRQHPIRT